MDYINEIKQAVEHLKTARNFLNETDTLKQPHLTIMKNREISCLNGIITLIDTLFINEANR